MLDFTPPSSQRPQANRPKNTRFPKTRQVAGTPLAHPSARKALLEIQRSSCAIASPPGKTARFPTGKETPRRSSKYPLYLAVPQMIRAS